MSKDLAEHQKIQEKRLDFCNDLHEHKKDQEKRLLGEKPIPTQTELFAKEKEQFSFGGDGPRFDINDSESSLDITSKWGDFGKDEVKVDIKQGNLIITGEKRNEQTDESTGSSHRTYKSFSRSIPLPDNVDKAALHTQYGDDGLTIQIPKMKSTR